MATYDDDRLPLQPPIRLPAEADLAAAVRAAPLARLLPSPPGGQDSSGGQGTPDARGTSDEPGTPDALGAVALPGVTAEVVEGLRSGPAGPEAVEVLRTGPAVEVLRVWQEVCRHLFAADQPLFLQLVRLFLGRDPIGEPPGVLFALGLADRLPSPEDGDEADPERSARRYALTPLGLWAARQMIAEVTGQDIPVMGSFAAQDAVTLLHGLRSYPEAARIEELTGWLAGRDRAKAAEEIGAALAEAGPLGRAIGVELLALDLGDDGRRVLDRLLGVRKLGAVIAARMGRDEHRSSPEEIAWVFVDMAAALLEFGGETDEVIESMTKGMDPDQQASTIALLALGDHPWTERVLSVIIDRHPDERVRAAARKALRRLHSLAPLRG